MSYNNNKNGKRGFTLVELAIVVVVIGLIIGGVVKGQQLIESARINAVINQVNGLKSAVAEFQERYGGLPGDLASAQSRLPGCSEAAAACANGDGDGLVGTQSLSNYTPNGAEGHMFWQHLAFANLITGVTPGVPADNVEFGTGYPAARTGGGYIAFQASIGSTATALSGLWLRLQNQSPTASVSLNSGEGALTPGEAALIDRRMDDGNPLTGYVRGGGVTDTCARADGTYDETRATKDCDLFFFIS